MTIVQENKQWLQENQGIFRLIIEYYRNYQYPTIENLDADASLYQAGFPDDHDIKLSRQFHQVDLPQKIKLIDDFHKPELKILAGRILCRNYSADSLPALLVNDFILHQQNLFRNGNTISDYKGKPHISSATVLDEIAELRRNCEIDEAQKELLNQLETYVHARLNEN